jgi:ketosteroid isomerase-like protein
MILRTILVSVLTVLPSLALALSERSESNGQVKPVLSDQDILMQLERDWDEAFLRKDIPFIEKILADEFIAVYGDGSRGDKAKELKLTADFDQQIFGSSVGDFTVRIYGDTAVVWLTKRMLGPKDGKPIEVAYRYIDVFVLRDGRWQCVASQSTRVNTP